MRDLRAVHDALLGVYGPQGWWPADSPFEMAVGAILVQNTRWLNAERALDGLRERGWLTPAKLRHAPADAVSEAIRPAGFWRSKAPRLIGFAAWLESAGGFHNLGRLATPELRRALLDVPGIGPETADCLLVYAFSRPVFIASAYARRLVARLGLPGAPPASSGYEPLRRWAETRLPPEDGLMGEFHALIVQHCQQACTAAEPACDGCVLVEGCRTGLRRATGGRATGRRSCGR